jgi:hypothetical protein
MFYNMFGLYGAMILQIAPRVVILQVFEPSWILIELILKWCIDFFPISSVEFRLMLHIVIGWDRHVSWIVGAICCNVLCVLLMFKLPSYRHTLGWNLALIRKVHISNPGHSPSILTKVSVISIVPQSKLLT